MEVRHARDVDAIVHAVGIDGSMRWVVPGHAPSDDESPFNIACETARLVALTTPLTCLVCAARYEVYFYGYRDSIR